jgi:hypothetical protein
LVPECVPLKPKLADAPGATLPFQPALVAVTCEPDWVAVPDQAWVMVWPLPKLNFNVQPFHAEALVFRTVMSAVKPVLQLLAV